MLDILNIMTVFLEMVDMLDIMTALFKMLNVLDMLKMLYITTVFRPCPPPLGLMFLTHQMSFPATLDNPIPQNINILGRYTD